MKYRFAAFLAIFAVILIVWQAIAWRAVHAQPAPVVIPFAVGLSIHNDPGSVNLFALQPGMGYVPLQFGVSQSPYVLLTAISALTQLLSAGPKNLIAVPAGPTGVGRQSQLLSLADLDGNGSGGVAYGVRDQVIVYQGTKGLSFNALVTSGIVPGVLNTSYSIGQDVNSVFFADFNGDGLPDLAVGYDGGDGPGGIAILLNNGQGVFGKPVTYASGTPATNFVVLDLNHDGVLDIATVSLDQKVTILLGKGDGTFGSPVEYVIGAGPGSATGPGGGSGQAIAIADFNGDGHPDIAVGGTTGVLLGNGDGTFRAGSPLPAVASGTLIWAFAAGDLNGDGKMDLVYEDIQNQVLAPLYGNGDGTFQPGQTYSISPFPNSVVLADYNNDGRLDIINGRGDARLFFVGGSGSADILVNNGDGTFQGTPAYFPLPNSEAQSNFFSLSSIAAGNFGGAPPGVLASELGALTLFLGDGKGGLKAAQAVPLPANFIAGGVVAGDFNGDGQADAAVIQRGSSSIGISLSTAGGLGTLSVIPAGVTPAAIASADLDGDGKADLAVIGQANGAGTLVFLKSNGNGTFAAPVSMPAGVSPVSLAVADINADGKPDLIFSDSGPESGLGGVYVALGKGGAAFQTPVQVFSGYNASFGIGDINGDGKLDLAVSANPQAQSPNVLSWMAGNGDGTFQAPVMIGTTDIINAILVQDFNSDGHADIVFVQQDSNSVFLAGNGDGTFSAQTPFLSTPEPTLLATTDLNGDGKPDLIVGGFTMTVFLNKSALSAKAGVASAAPAISTAIAPGSLASAYGADLANRNAGGVSLPLPTSFGGTSISILDASGNVTAAPLLYVVPTQVNFEVPPGLATGPATITITSGDGKPSVANVQVASVAPGIFTLNTGGLAAAYVILYHADGSQTVEQVYTVSAGSVVASPVSLGSATDKPYLFIFGTGLEDAGTSGVKVTVGGVNVPVSYAGPQGGFVGLDQVNVQLPASLAGKGSVLVEVTASGIAANAVNMSIR